MLDEPTRRLMRFSLFLQGFAFLMMGVALVVYTTAFGWSLVSWILSAVLLVIAGAVVWTVMRLRAG